MMVKILDDLLQEYSPEDVEYLRNFPEYRLLPGWLKRRYTLREWAWLGVQGRHRAREEGESVEPPYEGEP